MKGFALLLLAAVSGLLIGCTDQTSIVEPASYQAPSMSTPDTPGPDHGTWTIDRLVYVKEAETVYHIYADITWMLTQNGGEYALSTEVKAEIRNVTEQGAAVGVSGSEVSKGEVSKSGNTIVVTDFSTDELASSSALRITYNVGERVRLSDVQIVMRPWDSRKAHLD
jgi:hypothetical protein